MAAPSDLGICRLCVDVSSTSWHLAAVHVLLKCLLLLPFSTKWQYKSASAILVKKYLSNINYGVLYSNT